MTRFKKPECFSFLIICQGCLQRSFQKECIERNHKLFMDSPHRIYEVIECGVCDSVRRCCTVMCWSQYLITSKWPKYSSVGTLGSHMHSEDPLWVTREWPYFCWPSFLNRFRLSEAGEEQVLRLTEDWAVRWKLQLISFLSIFFFPVP